MAAVRLPGGKIIFISQHAGDAVIDLNQFPEIDAAIKQEDVVVTGSWTDFSGSGTSSSKNPALLGQENIDFGDLDLNVDKKKTYIYTDRGVRASTHRQRPKLVTVEVK